MNARPCENVVLFLNQRLTAWNYKRFGVETLRRFGLEVAIVDFSPFLYPGLRDCPEEQQLDGIASASEVHNADEAIRAAEAVSPASFVISFLPEDLACYPVFEVFSRRGVRYAVWVSNAMPGPQGRRAFVARKVRLLRAGPCELLRRAILKRQAIRFARLCGQLRGATYWLAGGSESISGRHYPRDRATEILWLHQLDYDVYLEQQKKREPKPSIAVFLDGGGYLHPDGIALGTKLSVPVETYHGALTRFFALLEDRFKVKVHIAAHPRSPRGGAYRQIFGGRCVEWDSTARLVAASRFVILHQSTAINFAVLYRKPMVFVVAPGNPWFVRDEIASLAGRFGSTPADLRRDCAREVDTVSLRVPTELYEQYEEAYIKRRTSPAKPFWEVVAERLCSTEEKRSRDGQPYC